MPEARSGASSNESVIKPIDALSAHRITSGQVVVDLQTAVKELVENSLDAGATTIEVRFKNYGLDSIEVIDNGTGVAPADYDAVALKHHTSKLASFDDLASVSSFGFRGEALSSLCALSGSVTMVTATVSEAPMATILEFDKQGRISDRSGRAARQRGTTVTISGLFKPLPVRRKELERNAKREFGKALHLLNAYALVPCASENGGVKLACWNQPAGGRKAEQFRTDGSLSTRSSIAALWGTKTLENLDELNLKFEVETEKSVLRRLQSSQNTDSTRGRTANNEVRVKGVISKFVLNCGRSSADRQFFYINGRPCQPSKVQKAFNEVYRTFNATQSPMVVANFILPRESLDINVSPDKRTIFIHSEDNLVLALKTALEERFAPERSTYDVRPEAQQQLSQTRAEKGASDTTAKSVRAKTKSQSQLEPINVEETSPEPNVETKGKGKKKAAPLFLPDENEEDEQALVATQSSEGQKETSPERVDHTSSDITNPFGRPVLLMDDQTKAVPQTSADVVSATDTKPTSPSVSILQTLQLGQEEDRMEIDIDDVDVQPAAQASVGDASARISGLQASDIPTSPASGSAVSDTTRTTEEFIHQIPPPRFLSRSKGSSSSSTGSFSDRAGAIRNLAKIGGISVSSPRTNTSAAAAKRDAGQMVLSTSGASWNLKHQDREGDADSIERPAKRHKASGDEVTSKEKKQAFKSMLAGYAMPGSQMQTSEAEDDEDEGDELSDTKAGDQMHIEVEDEGELQDELMDEERQESVVQQGSTSRHPRRVSPLASSGTSAVDAIDLTEDREEDAEMASEDVIDEDEEDNSLPEIVRTAERETVTMRCDIQAMMASWARLCESRTLEPDHAANEPQSDPKANLNNDAGLSNADDTTRANDALSRVIEKADFAAMEILGQFNLGFIIVRLRKSMGSESGVNDGTGMDDLFIVDQHAADEKYNFETLQQTTKIESQTLIRPKPLEFSAGDELLALDNLDVLRQNGFEVQEASESESQTRRPRLNLIAQPVSKSTVFDLRDLEELIHLMQDQPQGQMVRCSKARAMFAMRACRMSVMIGMPLTTKQMISIVRNMGKMHQPWNCPHGRPTMRHMSDISTAGRSRLKRKNIIDWQAFLDMGELEPDEE